MSVPSGLHRCTLFSVGEATEPEVRLCPSGDQARARVLTQNNRADVERRRCGATNRSAGCSNSGRCGSSGAGCRAVQVLALVLEGPQLGEQHVKGWSVLRVQFEHCPLKVLHSVKL